MPVYTADVADVPNQLRAAVTPTGIGWLVWQVIDSAFPVGGFSHSSGLEAAVQLGFVRSAEDLAGFVRTALWQSAKLAGPFVVAVANDASRFDELNQRYDVLIVNAVANAASRAQGAAMLAAGEAILEDDRMRSARTRLRAVHGFAHLPHAFALLATAAGMTAAAATDAFFFQQARSLFSAAVRLSVVGPMEAQRLLTCVGDDRAALLASAVVTPVDDAAQTAPTLDLLQSLHERLYSRLFVS